MCVFVCLMHIAHQNQNLFGMQLRVLFLYAFIETLCALC